jgi:hypothetical protein
MKNFFAALVLVSSSATAVAQEMWCSTVIENLESGQRTVGFTVTGPPTREQSAQGLASGQRLGAVVAVDPSRTEKITGILKLGRNRGTAGTFDLWVFRSRNDVRSGAAYSELKKDLEVATAGQTGSTTQFSFWAGRVRYKDGSEQYVTTVPTYAYSTGKEYIEHNCQMCSPKLGTCPNLEDPSVLKQEAAKLNATLVELKPFDFF